MNGFNSIKQFLDDKQRLSPLNKKQVVPIFYVLYSGVCIGVLHCVLLVFLFPV